VQSVKKVNALTGANFTNLYKIKYTNRSGVELRKIIDFYLLTTKLLENPAKLPPLFSVKYHINYVNNAVP